MRLLRGFVVLELQCRINWFQVKHYKKKYPSGHNTELVKMCVPVKHFVQKCGPKKVCETMKSFILPQTIEIYAKQSFATFPYFCLDINSSM